jgi:hypothetical protein
MWVWSPRDPTTELGAGGALASADEFSLALQGQGGGNLWSAFATSPSGGGDAAAEPLQLPFCGHEGWGAQLAAHNLCKLSLSDWGLTSEGLPTPAIWTLRGLRTLDLSRNRIEVLAPEVGSLTSLRVLDVSRNRIKELPREIGLLSHLEALHAQSNHLRPAARSLPLRELGALPKLRTIDLRYNKKLKSAGGLLARSVPQAKAIIAGPAPGGAKPTKGPAVTAGTRDPSLLRSQLEPLSTPQLRRRLAHEFGQPTDPETLGREGVISLLLQAYEAEGAAGRHVGALDGVPLPRPLAASLLEELRSIDWAATVRERPSVCADGYVTLQRPPSSATEGGDEGAADKGGASPPKKRSKKVRDAEAKQRKFARLWALAAEAIRGVDPHHAATYSAIAVSKGFKGSPHIDTYLPTYSVLCTLDASAACAHPGSYCSSPTDSSSSTVHSIAGTTLGRSTRCRWATSAEGSCVSSAVRGSSRRSTRTVAWPSWTVASPTGCFRTRGSATR